ncbi:MAG: OsmC family protein [Candidatus Bathyarchaeota archaeon]|nr:MAG: OsmC family protein [Candidatus Bathyarchaeota archaeon]
MIKAKAKWLEDFRQVVTNERGHEVVCDETVTGGGGDVGPTPLELAVMALTGCAVRIFADVCMQSRIKLNKLEVAAEAEKQPGSARLSEVNLKVTVSADAREQLLEAAWRRTEANCPVLLIYQKNVPVGVDFKVVSG